MKILIELKCPDNDVCVAISQYLLKKYSSEMESVSVVPDSEYVTEDQMEAKLREAFEAGRETQFVSTGDYWGHVAQKYPTFNDWRNR